jgi:hypothetical protein
VAPVQPRNWARWCRCAARPSTRCCGLPREHGLGDCCRVIGGPPSADRIVIRGGRATLLDASRADLQRLWSETSWQMQRLRDNPDCADEERARIDADDPGCTRRWASIPPTTSPRR